MSKELSQEAIKLLQYLIKNKDTSDFFDCFGVSAICHRKGRLKVEKVKPLVEELVSVKALIPSKEFFRAPKYSINMGKAAKILEENEESTIYTPEYRKALEDEIKNYKKFVITTAVMGKEVNKPFANSLRNFAKRNKALLLILPCEDVVSRGKKAKKLEVDLELSDFKVVFKDTYINKNLCLCAIKVSAKQINPLTGLDRLTEQRKASIIIASPKVFLKYIPNMHYLIPPALMTTGAVTVNNYDTDKYMSKRTSTLAEGDHTYGAIVVEVENENIFHFRHVQASSYNSITDMGIDYLPDGRTKSMDNSVMIMGDSHTGYHDKELHDEIMKVAHKTGVDTIFLHDVFNGTSITHHDNNKGITKAVKALEGRLSLGLECLAVKNYIRSIVDEGFNVVIPEANHNLHLTRFLEEGRYLNDPTNYIFSLKLALAAADGQNPLQYAIEELLGYKNSSVKWLKMDESCEVYEVQVGIHGDKGACGAKGSLNTFNKGVGNCVVGHSHTGAILRSTFSVGTVGALDMDYNQGLSNWTHTCCLIYKNGTKQLLNFIPNKEGTYKYTI